MPASAPQLDMADAPTADQGNPFAMHSLGEALISEVVASTPMPPGLPAMPVFRMGGQFPFPGFLAVDTIAGFTAPKQVRTCLPGVWGMAGTSSFWQQGRCSCM